MDTNTTNQNGEEILTEVENDIRNHFDLLPKDIQDVITSSGYQEKLYNLAKKYKITYGDLGQVELETTMVLLGMTKPADFENKLRDALPNNKDIVPAMIKELSEVVFMPIHQSLMKVHGESADTPAAATPSAPAATKLETNDQNVMSKAGIEIMDGASFQTPVNAPRPATPAATANPFEQKLSSTTVADKKATDTNLGGGKDPYREAI